MPRSVLISKMDGEEGLRSAIWELVATTWTSGTAPRLGAKFGRQTSQLFRHLN